MHVYSSAFSLSKPLGDGGLQPRETTTPSAEGFKGETLLQGLCNRVATKGSNQ